MQRFRGSSWKHDTRQPTVRFFDVDLNYLGSFLRRGRGPGEMLPFRIRTGSAIPDFLAVAGQQLVVLDHNDNQTLSFSADRKPRQVLTRGHWQYGWSERPHPRMRWSADTLFFGGGSFYPILPPGTKDKPVFHVRAVSGGRARTLAMLPVQAPFRTPSGAFMVGPSEALPIWDITSNCILINDGHSPKVYIWTRSTGRRHDLQFELPDDMEPAYTFDDSPFEPNRAFPQGFRFPEPNLQLRMSDMTMAPDGVIWIELAPSVQRAERKIIVRLRADGSAQRVDTLPAFPKVFMEDGTWYGLGYLKYGTAVVWKGRQGLR